MMQKRKCPLRHPHGACTHHLSVHTLLGVVDQGTVGPLSPAPELSGFRHSSACSGGWPKGLDAKLCLPLLACLSPPHPNFVLPAATEGQAVQLGPRPRPSPRESGALPTVRMPGSQNPCTSPLPRSPGPPRDSRENTRAPPRGDTHFPLPPPSAPRAPSSPKE